MMTDERKKELDDLAVDVVAGKVFGTWNIREFEDVRIVFMVLGFLSDEDIAGMKAKGVTHLYEYLDQAGPRSVNGMPMFMSARQLTKDDCEYLAKRCNAIKDGIKTAKEVEI